MATELVRKDNRREGFSRIKYQIFLGQIKWIKQLHVVGFMKIYTLSLFNLKQDYLVMKTSLIKCAN